MLGVAVVAWGTLAMGWWSHVAKPARLAALLDVHLHDTRRARAAASALIALESMLVVGALVGYFGHIELLIDLVAIGGFAVGVGFVVWVARLVLSDAGLPCACSYSSVPPTWWAVDRAGVVCGFGAFAAATPVSVIGLWVAVGTFVGGLALGAVAYTLPEALSWPVEAKRLRRAAGAMRGARPGEVSP